MNSLFLFKNKYVFFTIKSLAFIQHPSLFLVINHVPTGLPTRIGLPVVAFHLPSKALVLLGSIIRLFGFLIIF